MKLFHIYEVNKEDMINYLDILLLLSYFITTKNIVHIQVRFFLTEMRDRSTMWKQHDSNKIEINANSLKKYAIIAFKTG